ncbi:hypothetical protein F5876DRAFT_62288 [Lentinula aff. lateritia]|uniref:Uncharacterized protein n=1 Tax=Lentinula aff. lateritia TaxID=2804960 RepID=A0ACC1UBR8_9AGAR|nr:hypothetical protein F5876DRAFT_62288 [Lentinula aff. lateritia]
MDLDLISDATEVRDTNYVAFVGFTIMIWDHLDTFTTEVEYVWPRVGEKKPSQEYPFPLKHNRYLIPLGFIVNLFAYLRIDQETCQHFVRYEGAMTMIGINIVGLMMLIRNQKFIVAGVAMLLLIEMGTYAWLMSTGKPVQHHPNIICQSSMYMWELIFAYVCGAQISAACTMVFGEKNSIATSSSAWLPLLYDTVVLVLTLGATIPSVRDARGSATVYVMRRLLQDGLIYFGVIFAVNLVLSLMIAVADSGLKNITAQLELLVTGTGFNQRVCLLLAQVTMMSRITLNLMQSPDKHQDHIEVFPLNPVQSRAYQSNTDNHISETWRPNSLSLPAPLVNPPLIHTPTPGKGRDQEYKAPVDDIEFERRSLAFSSHPYAMTRPRYD